MLVKKKKKKIEKKIGSLACELCTGPSQFECQKCRPGFYLHLATQACDVSCPQGFYRDEARWECRVCREGCATCLTSEVCTSCSPGSYLQGNQCGGNCTGAFYPSRETNACAPCSLACSRCDGPTPSDCTECRGEFGFYLHVATKTCATGCPPGTVRSPSAALCVACDPRCELCQGFSPTNCTRCSLGNILRDNTCGPANCPAGTYADPVSRSCQPCSGACRTCSAPGASSCQSCSPGFFYLEDRSSCLSGKARKLTY